jgi:hypothetical protein
MIDGIMNLDLGKTGELSIGRTGMIGNNAVVNAQQASVSANGGKPYGIQGAAYKGSAIEARHSAENERSRLRYFGVIEDRNATDEQKTMARVMLRRCELQWPEEWEFANSDDEADRLRLIDEIKIANVAVAAWLEANGMER